MTLPSDPRIGWGPGRAGALWDAWAFSAVEAELALSMWLNAAHHLKNATYAAYRHALDREEEAATRLAACVAPKVGRRLKTRRIANSAAA